MILDVFLPATLRNPSAENKLRAWTMAAFNLFYLLVLCPVFILSMREPFASGYGMLVIAGTVLAGLVSLIYLKLSGDYAKIGLFLCTFCVGISTLLALDADAAFTPSIYWLPFLLTLATLLSGLHGSIAFGAVSCFLLLAYFMVAQRMDIPDVKAWPNWSQLVLINMVLAQLAFYAVIFIFEILREADRKDLLDQKHRLMRSVKGQSTQALNRLMEKKLLASADVNRHTIATLQKNPTRDSKSNLEVLEQLSRQLDSICRVAETFLDDSRDLMPVKDFMPFLEAILLEDPQFRLLDFQFQSYPTQGFIPLNFHEVYPLLEVSLEQLLRPWRSAQQLRVLVNAEQVADTMQLRINVQVPQGLSVEGLSFDSELFSGSRIRPILDIQPALIRLTLCLPFQA